MGWGEGGRARFGLFSFSRESLDVCCRGRPLPAGPRCCECRGTSVRQSRGGAGGAAGPAPLRGPRWRLCRQRPLRKAEDRRPSAGSGGRRRATVPAPSVWEPAPGFSFANETRECELGGQETKSKWLRDRQHHPPALSPWLRCSGGRREGGLWYVKVLCVEHKAEGSGKWGHGGWCGQLRLLARTTILLAGKLRVTAFIFTGGGLDVASLLCIHWVQWILLGAAGGTPMNPVTLQSRVLGCETGAMEVPWGSQCREGTEESALVGTTLCWGIPERQAGCQKQWNSWSGAWQKVAAGVSKSPSL